jgi:signal transduction histidine kinase/DNA-binding response OmpR family regulator/HAMP domain-containing protein
MTIQSKLFLACGVIVALMILANIFAWSQLIRTDRRYGDLISSSIQRQIDLFDAAGGIMELRWHNLARMYGLSGGVQAELVLEQVKTREPLTEAAFNNMQSYRDNVMADRDIDESEKQKRLTKLDKLDELFAEFVQFSAAVSKAEDNRDEQALAAAMLTGLPAAKALLVGIKDLQQLAYITATDTSQLVSEQSVGAIRLVAAISGCIVVLSILVAAVIAKAVKTPIAHLQQAMAEISRGNLAHPIRSERRDELGILSNHIGDMVDNIAEMNKTKAVIDYLDGMICIADVEYNIIYMSDNMVKAYGLDKENGLRKKCYEALRNLSQPCSHCLLPRISETQQKLSHDYEYFWDQQLGKRLGGKATVIRWVDGSLVQFHYFTDETLKHEYEAKLLEAAQAAEAASKAKSDFLAKMSHEIRTPMNAILGITEILLAGGTSPRETLEGLDKIHCSADLLLGIINDILDLAKVEAGKLQLIPDKYDVASLINDTVHLNLMRLGSTPVEFKLDVDENIPAQLFGDALRIKQILNNLLSNAFKYTEHGEITLSISVESGNGQDDAHEPGLENHGEPSSPAAPPEASEVTLTFRVRDTGRGMTAEQMGKLFDEYTRFREDANRTISGTGLGMPITRNLIQLMRGEIVVESEPDKGSVFTVRLPQGSIDAGVLGREVAENLRLFRADHVPQMKTAQLIYEPMPYGKILVVDDVETNLYVAKGLMRRYHLQIDTAASGFEAIEKIQGNGEYDVVFMDHMMPRMDGMEATKILRGQGYTRPIVALTANVVLGQAEIFLANGFDNVLAKPIDLRQLNAMLNKLVRDTQAPEVIEDARRQHGFSSADTDDSAEQPQIDPLLAASFVRDAEDAVAMMEAAYDNGAQAGEAGLDMYTIKAHAMKSALANIGEEQLAATSSRLEQAGRRRDLAVIAAETPAFLDALRAVIKKARPKEEPEHNAGQDEDQASLREHLLAIHAACMAYDIDTAENALAELRQKTWSQQTRALLDSITGHLLHSELEKAAGTIENFAGAAAR